MITKIIWTPEQVKQWNDLIVAIRTDEPAIDENDTEEIDVAGYLADTKYEDQRDERNAS